MKKILALTIISMLLIRCGHNKEPINNLDSLNTGEEYVLEDLLRRITQIPTDSSADEAIYFELKVYNPDKNKKVMLTFLKKKKLNYVPLLQTYKLYNIITEIPEHKGELPKHKYIIDLTKFYIASDYSNTGEQFVASAKTLSELTEMILKEISLNCKSNCTVRIVYMPSGKVFHIRSKNIAIEQWLN